eukprot:TRINITY_DN6524_c0_g1_i1.p1 TRINITY_DN6524_c0_g1~~TRINITY_DN6524_c0_g1_i1.p1  ORF type:complete len:431 (+),score=67.85 TRINITY_DN6524_c0_g1_i1:54-1346(+)
MKRFSSGHWKNIRNQRSYLDSISKKLGVKHWEDWYHIGYDEIIENGGSSLLDHYKHSLTKAVITAYPEHPFRLWKFSRKISPQFWKKTDNHRIYLDQVAEELQIIDWESWYHVQPESIVEFGGRSLLEYYGNSLIKALETVYPEHSWKTYKFDKVPSGYWKDLSHQRTFLEDVVASKFGIQKPDDWYRVTNQQIIDCGGSGFLAESGHSLANALSRVYPHQNWQQWRFGRVSDGFWNDEKNVKDFMEWLIPKLGINQLDDWYSVSTKELHHFGMKTLLDKHGGLIPFLAKFYPEHQWDYQRAKRFSISKSQAYLFRAVAELFLHREIFSNFLHSKLRFAKTQQFMELDVFIPSLNLAFEFQGPQHYTEHYNSDHDGVMNRDAEKRLACKNIGITLIEIPHWWNLDKKPLIQMITKERPDLLTFLSSKVAL